MTCLRLDRPYSKSKRNQALHPDHMELIGRSLIRRGEVVFLIDTTGGQVELLPAQTHSVEAGPVDVELSSDTGGPQPHVDIRQRALGLCSPLDVRPGP